MDKECNETGKDVVKKSKMTKASPRCMLKFLKKDEPEGKEGEPTIQELKIHFPR
jgi:hypothetical protein